MPLKTPTDYNELVKLTDTIDTMKTLAKRIEDNAERIRAYEGVEIDYRHPDLPFAKAVKQLDEDAEAPSASKKFRTLIYTILIGLIAAALPLAAYWFLDLGEYFPAAIEDYGFYIAAGVGVLLFVLLFVLTRKPVYRRVDSMTRARIVRKGQAALAEVKEQSAIMASSATEQIANELSRLKRQHKEDDTNLKGLERKIQKETLVPEHMLPQLTRLLTYFTDRRADTIKEAVNLMIEEDERKFALKRLLYGIRHDDVSIDDVFDPDYALEPTADDDFVGPPAPEKLADEQKEAQAESSTPPVKTPSLNDPMFSFVKLDIPTTTVSTASIMAKSETTPDKPDKSTLTSSEKTPPAKPESPISKPASTTTPIRPETSAPKPIKQPEKPATELKPKETSPTKEADEKKDKAEVKPSKSQAPEADKVEDTKVSDDKKGKAPKGKKEKTPKEKKVKPPKEKKEKSPKEKKEKPTKEKKEKPPKEKKEKPVKEKKEKPPKDAKEKPKEIKPPPKKPKADKKGK